MRNFEFSLSNKIQNKIIKGNVQAKEIVTELLKHEEIKKPRNLKVEFCSIGDLTCNGKEIIGARISSLCSMYNGNGTITLEIK